MRRVAALLAGLLVSLLVACTAGTARTAPSPSPVVSYQVVYLISSTSAGSSIKATYTDDSGRQVREDAPSVVWTKQLTVNSTVEVVSVAGVLDGPFEAATSVECQIEINGQLVAHNQSLSVCSTNFTLRFFRPSAAPSAGSSPSPARPAPTKAAPVTRDPTCRYASDAEVSTVVSRYLGGDQEVLFTSSLYGGCGYHFTYTGVTQDVVVITYWHGTALPKGGESVAGLGGKATWDISRLSVQRSGGVVTVDVSLGGQDNDNKKIGIDLYKLIRNRIK